MNIKEQRIEIPTKDGPMDAFVALPGSTGSGAPHLRAALVVQEAFGVNHHIEEVCRRLAREGYIAIAPEFFHREARRLEFGYDEFPKIMPVFGRLTNEQIEEDLRATLKTLESRFATPSAQVVVIGFCLGGFVAMLAACRFPIGTAVSYYGGGMVEKRQGIGLSPILGELGKIRCPVLLFFGEKDTSIPLAQVRAIEEELKAGKKTFEVFVYPEAGHAFSNDDRPSFHAESAAAAWKETLAWLKRI